MRQRGYGDYGHIEFVHTAQRPDDVSRELTCDPDCRLWRASVRPVVEKDVLHHDILREMSGAG